MFNFILVSGPLATSYFFSSLLDVEILKFAHL